MLSVDEVDRCKRTHRSIPVHPGVFLLRLTTILAIIPPWVSYPYFQYTSGRLPTSTAPNRKCGDPGQQILGTPRPQRTALHGDRGPHEECVMEDLDSWVRAMESPILIDV